MTFILIAALCGTPAIARDGHIHVWGPDQALVDDVLARCTEHEQRIRREWLGCAPPDGRQLMIHLRVTPGVELMTAMNTSDGATLVWVRGSVEFIRSAELRHEVSHFVLGPDYPWWVIEGVACHYDTGWRRERWEAWEYDQATAERATRVRFERPRGSTPAERMRDFRRQSEKIREDTDAYAAAYWLVRYHARREGRVEFLRRRRIGR